MLVFNVNLVSCLLPDLSRCRALNPFPLDSTSYVGTHGTAHKRRAAAVLISPHTNPSHKTARHIAHTTLSHTVHSFTQAIPSCEYKHHIDSPTNQFWLWWCSYVPGHIKLAAPEKLCMRYIIQYRSCGHAYKSYVGSASSKVMLYTLNAWQ